MTTTMDTKTAAVVIDEAIKNQPKKRGCLGWLFSPRILWILIPLFLVYWDVLRAVPIRISPETTYITTPLTADGCRVDYFAGLEQLLYPPEMKTDENGARLLVRALGSESARLAAIGDPAEKEEREFRSKQVYEKLGLDPTLKPTLTYQEPLGFLRELEKTTGKDFTSELPYPLTVENCPELAEWLAQNNTVLDLVSEAVRKPVFFYPLTLAPNDERILYSAYLDDVLRSRSFVRGLAVRAHNRIAAGETDGAIDDTVSIFRLGRFMRKQGFLVGALVGIAIEGTGFSIEITGNPEHPPTFEQIARFQKELGTLPPQVTFDECMETERYSVLDSFQCMARGVSPGGPLVINASMASRIFDWNVMLRQTNRDFDVIQGKTAGPASIDDYDPRPRPWRMLLRSTRSLEVHKVMASLLVPSIQAAREAFRRLECSENFYALTLAMYRYNLDHGTLPPAFTLDAEGKPLHSWRVLLLPYLGEAELYAKIRLDEPWDSEYNRQFHETLLPMFQCPTKGNWTNPGQTAYSVVLGGETAFDDTGQGKPFPVKRDTILLVETLHNRNWMDPTGELVFEDALKIPTGPLRPDAGIGSFHVGGMNVGKANGSVEFLSEKTSVEELRRMLSYAE